MILSCFILVFCIINQAMASSAESCGNGILDEGETCDPKIKLSDGYKCDENCNLKRDDSCSLGTELSRLVCVANENDILGSVMCARTNGDNVYSNTDFGQTPGPVLYGASGIVGVGDKLFVSDDVDGGSISYLDFSAPIIEEGKIKSDSIPVFEMLSGTFDHTNPNGLAFSNGNLGVAFAASGSFGIIDIETSAGFQTVCPEGQNQCHGTMQAITTDDQGGFYFGHSNEFWHAKLQADNTYQVDFLVDLAILFPGFTSQGGATLVQKDDSEYLILSDYNNGSLVMADMKSADPKWESVSIDVFQPRGLALDENEGILYITSYGHNRVYRVSFDLILDALDSRDSVTTEVFLENTGEATGVDVSMKICLPQLCIPQDEVCDGKDNDCDGMIDEDWFTETFYKDGDGDGHGTPHTSLEYCEAPDEYVDNNDDCDDIDPDIYFGADELCDGKDNDCDGEFDEDCDCDPGETQTCGFDEGECQSGMQKCDSDGYWMACEGVISPVGETCDSKDNDCDGEIDEELDCFDISNLEDGAFEDDAIDENIEINEEDSNEISIGIGSNLSGGAFDCGCDLNPAAYHQANHLYYALLGLLILIAVLRLRLSLKCQK